MSQSEVSFFPYVCLPFICYLLRRGFAAALIGLLFVSALHLRNEELHRRLSRWSAVDRHPGAKGPFEQAEPMTKCKMVVGSMLQIDTKWILMISMLKLEHSILYHPLKCIQKQESSSFRSLAVGCGWWHPFGNNLDTPPKNTYCLVFTLQSPRIANNLTWQWRINSGLKTILGPKGEINSYKILSKPTKTRTNWFLDVSSKSEEHPSQGFNMNCQTRWGLAQTSPAVASQLRCYLLQPSGSTFTPAIYGRSVGDKRCNRKPWLNTPSI